jgi:hypothetical protein
VATAKEMSTPAPSAIEVTKGALVGIHIAEQLGHVGGVTAGEQRLGVVAADEVLSGGGGLSPGYLGLYRRGIGRPVDCTTPAESCQEIGRVGQCGIARPDAISIPSTACRFLSRGRRRGLALCAFSRHFAARSGSRPGAASSLGSSPGAGTQIADAFAIIVASSSTGSKRS